MLGGYVRVRATIAMTLLLGMALMLAVSAASLPI